RFNLWLRFSILRNDSFSTHYLLGLAKSSNGYHQHATLHRRQWIYRCLDLPILEPCIDSYWSSPLGIHSIPIRSSRCCRRFATILVATPCCIRCKYYTTFTNP